VGKLAITGGKALRKTPFTRWPIPTKAEASALKNVLESTLWGGQPFPGKHAAAFAAKFAKLHTAKYGQCVNTGTVAIQAALKAIGIKPGDEVIVPAYTWEGTVGPVLLVNAVPVFVDVDPDTYCLDAKLIEKAITPKTKAILPVHLGMRFADMDEILRVAAKHKLKVVEDCAHAHGGEFQAAVLGAQLERMPKQSAIREKNMKRFEARLQKTEGIGLLKPDPRITRLAPYGYVIKYFAEKVKEIPRAAFVAAMQLEGVHCDGLFYEPVYKSSLFPVDATDFPALSWGREKALDLRSMYSCPESEKAAYQEAVWFPHQHFLWRW